MRLRDHWPEYLIEALGLGVFMVSACVFGVALEHPASPVRSVLPDPFARRALMGLAMGLTAVAIIYSPWGQRSGAHINPSVTLTFLRLGKVDPGDAAFYVAAQFLGGLAGVFLATAVLGASVSHPAVNYVATLPGMAGRAVAFLAETAISFGVMMTVLLTSNRPAISRFTGIFVGCLVAGYIAFEAPFSGMSMNPARTLGSAVPAAAFEALWIYFTAPLLGMLLAAETYLRLFGREWIFCAKLHHDNPQPCIFCEYQHPSESF